MRYPKWICLRNDFLRTIDDTYTALLECSQHVKTYRLFFFLPCTVKCRENAITVRLQKYHPTWIRTWNNKPKNKNESWLSHLRLYLNSITIRCDNEPRERRKHAHCTFSIQNSTNKSLSNLRHRKNIYSENAPRIVNDHYKNNSNNRHKKIHRYDIIGFVAYRILTHSMKSF